MSAAGLLVVRAAFGGQTVDAIEVDLQRPPVARLFVGQNPEAVVKTVPYLFTLCAHAQRAAAQAALAAAEGEVRRPVDDSELWIEFLHENLWRLLLDWPLALGLPPANEAFIAWRAARQGNDRQAVTRQVVAGPLRELAEQCRDRLVDHSPPEVVLSGSHYTNFDFPALTPEAWLAYWQGQDDRQPEAARPASVGTAYRRRLAEVDLACAALETARPYPLAGAGQAGWGIGQTLTARGVLTHAVHVEEERVNNYRVWAPTDCHFADAVALQTLLAGRQFANLDAARHGLEQAILALDPCLPYTLEIVHA